MLISFQLLNGALVERLRQAAEHIELLKRGFKSGERLI